MSFSFMSRPKQRFESLQVGSGYVAVDDILPLESILLDMIIMSLNNHFCCNAQNEAVA